MADGDNLVIGATKDSGLPTGLDRTGATPWTALLVTNANGSAVEAEAARRLATFDVPEFPPEPEALVPSELPEVTAPTPPEWPKLPWETQTEA
jgi:hypothetical protein